MFKFFTNARILQQLGHARVSRLLDAFETDLHAAKLSAPPPLPATHFYFTEVADFLANTENLPPRLLDVMRAIEAHAQHSVQASPKNTTLDFRPETSDLADSLARALDLWFAGVLSSSSSVSGVPEPQSSSSSSSSSSPEQSEVPIPNRDSSPAGSEVQGSAVHGSTVSVADSEPSTFNFQPSTSPGPDKQIINPKSEIINSTQGARPEGPKIENHNALDCRSPATAIEEPTSLENPRAETEDFASSQIKNQKSQIENDAAALSRLAALSPLEYDRVRKDEARKLGVRVEVLDGEVASRRNDYYDARANEVVFPVLEPWPEPVILSEVLDQALSRFILFTVMPAGGHTASALWSAHTHVFKAFAHSPRLNFRSIESGSGKTTAMDLLAALVPRPMRTESLTAPILFRVVQKHAPTLLLDEIDTYVYKDKELCGLINSGHKHGGCAFRTEGGVVRSFASFAPTAIAGLGVPPVPIHNRSIVIPLLPALPEELKHVFDRQNAEIENHIARKLARWAQDNFESLKRFKPTLPPGAWNRQADNWRPLFAIAQLAGGGWPQLAIEAFHHLVLKAPKTQSLAVMLLSDIRDIFTRTGAERLSSRLLVEELRALLGRSWNEANRNKPINEKWLATQLARFEISPTILRGEEARARGYEFVAFKQLFARYLTRDFRP